MKVLNEILAIIKEHPQTKSSGVLAAALASACNTSYSVSLLDVSASLDDNGKRLIERLTRITQEPDYSNSAQDQALHQLRTLGFIH
ncbi:hypothetical protein [Aeromonas sobria]|uniref:hypothetical protein n=1 Tax=Aeromonas sobria TaxID=646 RepID=UPI0011DF8E85|nr:hypothetical protein [Aeromonas sobria]